jgi:hypothetical protein
MTERPPPFSFRARWRVVSNAGNNAFRLFLAAVERQAFFDQPEKPAQSSTTH